MGIMKKITATTIAFTLAASALVTPVWATDKKEPSALEDFGTVIGGLLKDVTRAPDAIVGGLNKGMKGIGDAAEGSNITLPKNRIPTFAGRIPGGGPAACFTKTAEGGPNPKEMPYYSALHHHTQVPQQGGTGAIGSGFQLGNDRGADEYGSGGPNGLQALSAAMSMATLNCESAVKSGYLRAWGNNRDASVGGRETSRRATGWDLHIKCPAGYPADDDSGDTLLLPSTMQDQNKYGAGTVIMRCNPDDKLAPYKPVLASDLDKNILFPFTLKDSEELAKRANQKHLMAVQREIKAQNLLQKSLGDPSSRDTLQSQRPPPQSEYSPFQGQGFSPYSPY